MDSGTQVAGTKPVLHVSQMNMLSRCGEQYYRRYVKGEVIPPAVAMVTGTGTHRGVEENLRNKIATKGTLLPVAQVQQIAVDAFKAEWDRGVKLSEDEVSAGIDRVKGEAIDTVASLSALHHRELAPRIQPVHVERTFRLELPGYPLDLAGTMDIQEPRTVRDTKTAAKSPPSDAADVSAQLTMYALAVKTLEGAAPEKVCLDNLVKTKTPKVVVLESTRTDDDMRQFLQRVERSVEVIQKGAFTPADPSSWWCSKEWCGYHATCPFAAKRVQVAL